ncbi:ADP-ribosylation factor GTPase activating protein, ER-Golgi transport [Gonapodya sp. JEL0774]|nr:ADP-ribosylation factor GTPase activating protein, ER-Golgi transport [Gonapodya sp. JEL0774]
MDSWTLDQLRNMKCGGNDRIADFFRPYGGSDKFKDAKTKYTSRQAQLYLEKLAKLTAEDARRHPDKIILDDSEELQAENAQEDKSKADFFETHLSDPVLNGRASPSVARSGSPALSRSGTPTVAPPTTPPVSAFSPAPPVVKPTNSTADSTTSDATPDETTTWAVERSTTPKPQGPIYPLNSSPSAEQGSILMHAPAPSPSHAPAIRSTLLTTKKKGLGAKKANKAAAINFEEAERRAKEEEARIREEDERRKASEEETRKLDPFAAALTGSSAGSGSVGAGRLAYVDPTVPPGSRTPNQQKANDEAMDRLGMGMGRMGFGFDPTAGSQTGAAMGGAIRKSTTTAYTPNPAPTIGGGFGFGFGGSSASEPPSDTAEAQNRFGKAKAISSDMYFGRGNHVDEGGAEARDKLRQFEGKSGFGSADYYGRDEGIQPSSSPTGANLTDMASVVGSNAADFARRFSSQARDELDSLSRVATVAGGKLAQALQDFQVSLTCQIEEDKYADFRRPKRGGR